VLMLKRGIGVGVGAKVGAGGGGVVIRVEFGVHAGVGAELLLKLREGVVSVLNWGAGIGA
jgi:hypothetical protein